MVFYIKKLYYNKLVTYVGYYLDIQTDISNHL